MVKHSAIVLRSRSKSNLNLEGIDRFTRQDLEELKQLEIIPNGEEIFIKLKPEREDKEFNQDIKPAIAIINDYVDFYMARYGRYHDKERVRRGLWVEKAFDLMLQNIGVPKNYPEPIRDWRLLKPFDFYVPFVGKLEVKSTTEYDGILKFTIRISNWKREKPDYAVVLHTVDWDRERVWVQLMGAMPRKKVESYSGNPNTEIKHVKEPFWAIPCADLTISPAKLYQTLVDVKNKLQKMPLLDLSSN